MRHWIKGLWIVCVFLLLYSIFSLLTAHAQSPAPTKPAPGGKLLPLNAVLPAKKPVAPVNRGSQTLTTTAACDSTARASLPSGAVIVDDTTPQFHRYGDSQYWVEASGSTNDYYNGHMWYGWNSQDTVYTWAQWDAIVTPGLYEVWAFVPRYYSTTTAAKYKITHAGQTSYCTLNQNIYFAVWVRLGTYGFSSTSDNVQLADATGEATNTTFVGLDAIAFVPVKLYLPLVAKAPSLYEKTGIHLGNRDRDWNINASGQSVDFLARLRGAGRPAAVVVMSHQVYNINRDSGINNCNITGATVKNTWVFNYLRDVAQAGTKVLIRIWPSPGDFQDTFDYSKPHTLFHQASQTPQNHTYCGTHVVPGTTDYQPMSWFFRAIDDVAREMNAIHALNVSNGFSEYGFIPANEPNNEWYAAWRNTLPDWFPRVYNREAWQEMDAYFQSLYDYVRANYSSDIRVLTPTMAQGSYAETRQLSDSRGMCEPMIIYDEWGHEKAGYDFMPLTYNSKNDGYLWHNYYRQGKESWATGDACRVSDHIFQYFPSNMQSQIQASGKLSFIDETDLFSPCQRGDSPIKDKDANPALTRDSLWSFIGQEQRAQYTVAWLLSEDPYSPVPECPTGLTNYQEIRWHEAYRDDGTQRAWFTQWWQP